MRRRAQRLAAGVLVTALGCPTDVSANDAKYVSDLGIKVPKELIRDTVFDNVKDVARAKASEVLSDVAVTFLNAFAAGFLPGIGSLFGSGEGGAGSLEPEILASLKVLATQAGERFDSLEGALNNQTIDTAVTDLNAGIDLLNQYQATNTLNAKYERRGSLEQALLKFSECTDLIEAFTKSSETSEAAVSLWQLHMIAFGFYVTATIEYQNIAELGAETQGQSVDKASWFASRAVDPGFAQAFKDKVQVAVRGALLDKVNRTLAFYAEQGEPDVSTANKRGVASGFNKIHKLVDSWFTFVAGQNKCWDSKNDTAWQSRLQDPGAWNDDCAGCGGSNWSPSVACGNTAGAPWWYYNVHAPNARCLAKTNSASETEWNECNRFTITADGPTTYHGDFDNRLQAFTDGIVIPDEHFRRVYAAYLFQIYGPIKPYLDGLWVTVGNPGTRPPNGLDSTLDVEIDPEFANAIDPATTVKALAYTMNFEQLPGHSSALAMASIFP
jgi:hypothetical protein